MANKTKCMWVVLVLVIYNASSSIGVAGQARIVGGKDAAANSAPFIVSLQKVTPKGNDHYCGGTIINANWVVTAAHCICSSSTVSNSVIIAGSILVSGTTSTAQKRNIDYYVSNDNYVGDTNGYDIGLIYTKTAFTWTASVKAAALPKFKVIPTGTASLYGWGSTSTTSVAKYPSTLQTVSPLPILTESQCKQALGTLALNLHDTNICTGSINAGVSVCSADSGGPLMQSNTLIGIVSWGITPCGKVNSPSVYTRVSALIDWIEEHQVAPK